MTFNPHTTADRAAMLSTIGRERIEDVFDVIDEEVRFPRLSLPPALTEMEAVARLRTLSDRNRVVAPGRSFRGAGAYHHFIPAAVGQILSRGEFYTAYTPYQPEVSQGTLQLIYEYQTMVAALLGMEVANASMYDGATAVAEAALLAVAATRRRRVVVTGTVNPHYREVIRTYLAGVELELVELPMPLEGFTTNVAEVASSLSDETACLVVQYPNFFGGVEQIEALGQAIHDVGGLLVVATYPVALGLLHPPGALGADIVAAEGQALGVAQSFGGPYVGLLATRASLVRQLPGRLVGMTTDTAGKRGFVMTLQTREQHIRRERATSNICTNQGLMATAATVYMATLGPSGFREVADRCYQHAHYLAAKLTERDGFELALAPPFFHEFVVRCPEPAAALNRKVAKADLLGGFDLGEVDPALDRHWLLCATELTSRTMIDEFVAAL